MGFYVVAFAHFVIAVYSSSRYGYGVSDKMLARFVVGCTVYIEANQTQQVRIYTIEVRNPLHTGMRQR